LECKKKQDVLLKSGQWLSNSPALNKKNYTSDYILNKAAEVGLEIPIDIINQNISTQSKSSKRQLPNLNKIKQNSLDNHDNLIIDDSTNQKSYDHNEQSNSAQSVPDLLHDDHHNNNQTTKSSYLDEETNDNSDNQFSAPTLLINTRKSRLRQSLIKQASLNNPPNYYKDLNEDNFENQNESLYEKSRHHSTSNKELRKTTSSLINTTNNDNQYFSSPSSSISHINSTSFSQSKADRIQDPLVLLKKSSSRLNSVNNLTDIITDEAALFLNNKQEITIDAINVIKQPATVVPVRTASISKRTRELVKQPDSLSSDPSDILNIRDQEHQESDLLARKHLKTKRATTNPTKPNNNQRKQPALPSLIMNSNHLAAHQQKLLAKFNLKQQNSLTSSDDEIINNQTTNRNLRNQLEKNDSLENEIEEPEEEFNESEEINNEDIDEEIRSTTEYTTNDEMDLESGSISLNAHNRNTLIKKNNLIGNNNINNKNQKSIDNYLEQNLQKDEILAAKMNKFLSVCIKNNSILNFFNELLCKILIHI
jgi:hypothetical protein